MSSKDHRIRFGTRVDVDRFITETKIFPIDPPIQLEPGEYLFEVNLETEEPVALYQADQIPVPSEPPTFTFVRGNRVWPPEGKEEEGS